ncbi:hypothetical protein EGR_10514 [Echinococcus granulosus]|uniref:Uncharacterized protein n=1 Tax=Echinococcus granulosus TaxID=6210 RepID=W6U262_ECHGR|nr:hypothetical protein EGR_10514 [Echinococcus granulosus]EUB54621.1 hypothetical protein EGR_10514 [Echinococcus granulosus]
MDPLPYTYLRRGSQVPDNVPSRAAQLLVYPSPLTYPPSTPVVTPQKRVNLSPRFKRLLAIATALPLLALILVICTTLSPHWERVHFLFHRLIQRACSQQEKMTWLLAHVELEGVGVGGVRLFDNQTRWEMCQRWKEAPPTIVGVCIYNGSEQNATVIEVLNVLGGAFQMCKGKLGEGNLFRQTKYCGSIGGTIRGLEETPKQSLRLKADKMLPNVNLEGKNVRATCA